MQNIKIFDEVLVSFFHFSSILVLTIFGRFWTTPPNLLPWGYSSCGQNRTFFLYICAYIELILRFFRKQRGFGDMTPMLTPLSLYKKKCILLHTNQAWFAYLNPTKEMPELTPGSQSRPADIHIENWIDGGKIAFDVSVVSPTQDAIILRAAETPSAAIEMRKSSKNRDHFDNCRTKSISFKVQTPRRPNFWWLGHRRCQIPQETWPSQCRAMGE